MVAGVLQVIKVVLNIVGAFGYHSPVRITTVEGEIMNGLSRRAKMSCIRKRDG